MAMYFNCKKVRNLYYNGKCITRLALGKEMTRLVEGDDFVRAEWLVGDNTAYIQGISYDLWDNHVEVKIGKLLNSSSTYISYSNFYIAFNVTGQAFQVIFRQNDSGYTHIADIYPYSSMPDEVTMDFYIENSLFYCNQNGVVKTNNPSQTAIESTWKSVTPQIYSAKMSYIREVLPDGSYRSNLIPCRLLRPIPAALDGNGIARNAGECGMYDAVSGKFFGNVGGGAFTVEPSLIEGVDYERHKWLVADIPIGAAMMSLPINSSTFNCTIEHTGARANLPHLYSDGYIYYTESSNMDMIAVWNISEANIPFSASVGSLMIIESNEEYFKVNNISIPKYGFPILRMVIQSSYNSNNATTTKTSSITIDGIDRYIPIRLLRPLPSYLDANGKARKQFECGMLDLKTMKFYGNVGTTGTFTVSDN